MFRASCLAGILLCLAALDRAVLAADEITAKPGATEYSSPFGRNDKRSFVIYVPAAFDAGKPNPFIMVGHGKGGSGPKEVKMWEALAEQYGVVVICLTLTDPEGDGSGFSDSAALERMVSQIIRAAKTPLNLDFSRSMYTGFSAGGHSMWRCAISHPEWFAALCFRGPNYSDPVTNLRRWRDRPVFFFYGENETPGVKSTLEISMATLKSARLGKLEIRKVEGGHLPRCDIATKWFTEQFDITPKGDGESGGVAASEPESDGFRTWTDNAGRKIEAAFVSSDGSQVKLRNRDGRELAVPLSGLAGADREHVRALDGGSPSQPISTGVFPPP